jgi:hypothetical protein
MHTLKPNNEAANFPLYDVWFIGSDQLKAYRVEKSIPKQEALKLVNYLNGGLGLPAGSNVGIIDMDKM